MEVSEKQLLELKRLINSLDGLSFDKMKRIYPNCDIITIDKLKDYLQKRTKEQREYLQILLVLNSKIEHQGHYIVVDSYGNIFDPLGIAGLINMENITPENQEYIINNSNKEIIQTINSECCGLICLLFVFLNIITLNKNHCFVNVKGFKKIIDNLRSDETNKNIFNLIYELIMKIFKF